MKAKALTTILAAAMILTMTGCGKTDSISEGASESSAPPSSTVESTPPPEINKVTDSIIVLGDGRGIMLYSASYNGERKYAETVNKYKELLGENVNVYSMVIPSPVTFYLPEKYLEQGVSDRELPHIENINAQLSGVIPIDAYDALKSHVDEEIYHRTDHHWLPLGSYYAAQSFAKTAQVPFDELSEYDRHEQDGFTGSLYGPTYDPKLRANPETFVWYVPKRDVTTLCYDTKCENGIEKGYFCDTSAINGEENYYVVYHTEEVVNHINTGLDTGRRLMVIGDSFTWPFVPFLFGSFDEIWQVDVRFLETSAVQLAKEKGITDLLFCSSISSATRDYSECFEEIM